MASDGLKRTQRCQVDGCVYDLSTAKKYHYKRRLCPFHMQASAVYCSCLSSSSSGLYRFCQQCGRLQPLEDFEGNKKSCKESLTKRREGVLAIKAAAECYFAAQQGGEVDASSASSGHLSDSSIGSGQIAAAKLRKRKHGQKVLPPAITRKQKRRCKSHQQVQASAAATAAAAGYPAEPAAVPGHVEGDEISPKSSSHSVAESTATPTAPQQLLQTAALEHLYMNAKGSTGCDMVFNPSAAAVAPSDTGLGQHATAAAGAALGESAAAKGGASELPAAAAATAAAPAAAAASWTELLFPPTTVHLSGLESSAQPPAWLSGPDQAKTSSPGQISGYVNPSRCLTQQQQQQQQLEVATAQQAFAAGQAHSTADTIAVAPPAAAAGGGTFPVPLQLSRTQKLTAGLTASLGVNQLLPHLPTSQAAAAAAVDNGAHVACTNGSKRTAAPTRSQVLGSVAADDHFLHCKVPNCELCVTSIMNRLMKDLQHEAQDGKPACEAVAAEATSRLDLMPALGNNASSNGYGNLVVPAVGAAVGGSSVPQLQQLQQQRADLGLSVPMPLLCCRQNSITGNSSSRPPFMMTAPYAAPSASGQVPQSLLLNQSGQAAAAAAGAVRQSPQISAPSTGLLGSSGPAVHTALGTTNNSSQVVVPNSGLPPGMLPWSVSNGVNNNITSNGHTPQQVMYCITRMLWMLEQFSAYVEEVKGMVMRSVNNMPE